MRDPAHRRRGRTGVRRGMHARNMQENDIRQARERRARSRRVDAAE